MIDPRLSKPPRAPLGKTLTPELVREVVDYAIDKGEAEVVRVTEELSDGTIKLAEWQRRLERMLAVRHTAVSVIAIGGIAQVNGADRVFIGREIAEQLRFLRQFAKDIETGKERLPVGTKPGRAIDRTDDEIDVISTVTPTLESEARDWWVSDAPPGFGGMFDAETRER